MAKKNKSYTLKDIYASYVNEFDNELYLVEFNTFRNIVSDYMLYVAGTVILKAKEFKVPGNLGKLFVRKRAQKASNKAFLVVDPVKSRELKRRVYFVNDHSGGYSYSFRWSKIGAYVRNITMYELVMSRTNKRLLSSAIKRNITDYII